MIQDIAPHIFNNQYQPIGPDKDSYLLCFQKGEVLVGRSGDEICYPRFHEVENENEELYKSSRYLFAIDSARFYLANNLSVPQGSRYTMENIETLRRSFPQYLAFAGITGYQIYGWYQSRRFCGRCGEPMEHDIKERMMHCSSCGQREYPKLSPAVIVAITHGDRLLMSKYCGSRNRNYALIAGFAEIGETIEETVKREVMEEVGLKVKDLKYYKSQPWAFSDTLLMGFFAELDGKEDITLEEEELALAEWFNRQDIPENDSTLSLTNEMIRTFKAGKQP